MIVGQVARVANSKKYASKIIPSQQYNSVSKNATKGALKKLKVAVDSLPSEKVVETTEQGPVEALCREILKGKYSFDDLAKHQGIIESTESKMKDDEDEEEIMTERDGNIEAEEDHGDYIEEEDLEPGLDVEYYDVYEYEDEHEDDEDDSDYHDAYCGYGDEDDENDSDYQDVHDKYGLENDDDDDDEEEYYDA